LACISEKASFVDPAAITVSEDGRFILVADGYDDKSYLSAFLMEIDENPN
jgi:6-phosphogluconolactonase (cycloisomerase 2 family)